MANLNRGACWRNTRSSQQTPHLNEPQEVYDRLPTEYRARAPRIEVRDDQRYIIVEGQGPARIEAPNPSTKMI